MMRALGSDVVFEDKVWVSRHLKNRKSLTPSLGVGLEIESLGTVNTRLLHTDH